MGHGGIFVWCIVGFVRWLYCLVILNIVQYKWQHNVDCVQFFLWNGKVWQQQPYRDWRCWKPLIWQPWMIPPVMEGWHSNSFTAFVLRKLWGTVFIFKFNMIDRPSEHVYWFQLAWTSQNWLVQCLDVTLWSVKCYLSSAWCYNRCYTPVESYS